MKSFLLLALFAGVEPYANGQKTYLLDTSKSTIMWNSGEVGHHIGHIRFQSGSLLFSKNAQPVGGVFIVDMNTIKTADNKDEPKNLETDATIKKTEFFDVSNYPQSKIIVTKIKKAPISAYYQVSGELTIKGVTHPVEFLAAIQYKDKEVHVRAEIDLLRRWWGIDYKPRPTNTKVLAKPVTDQMFIAVQLVLR